MENRASTIAQEAKITAFFLYNQNRKIYFMACSKNHRWEMIAENAFGVFFIITKLFLGCIWHEKKKKVKPKSIFKGQCNGLSKLFSMGKSPESSLRSKIVGERVLIH